MIATRASTTDAMRGRTANRSTIGTILRHEARAVVKNRGVLIFGGGMLLVTESMLRLSGSAPRALASMLGLVLLVVPLVTMLFGVISWHSAREFNELLLAQPVRRSALFSGLYLGLVLPLACAFCVGLLLPFLLHRSLTADTLPLLAAMLGGGVALTLVFGGLALLIGVRVEDRLRGVGVAIGVWALLTIGYDAIALLVATTFSDYALEKPMLGLVMANPVDLARTMIVLQSDSAALMGYTGALMHRFLGSISGTLAALVGLSLWILVPAWAGRRAFERRDF